MDVINLEGLRQCFVHPLARIKQSCEESIFPRIERMQIEGDGFLGGLEFEFHSGLNSIIGGKGVGKSLAIELLRFALCDPPSDPDLLRDHRSKLAKQLVPGNRVIVFYQSESGTKYKIERLYNGEKGGQIQSEVECSNLDTGEPYEGEIGRVLPILAYSQTEVVKISDSADAQLKLIDRFLDQRDTLQEVHDLHTELKENDQLLSRSIDASGHLEQLQRDINTQKGGDCQSG